MKLAIKGHATRGAEVIQLLEMLGGKNKFNCKGCNQGSYYYILSDFISNRSDAEQYFKFTLETFESQYPYKVGEKVLYLNDRRQWVEGIIESMKWNETNNNLYYYIKDAGIATTMFLKPMKKLKDYLKPGYIVEYEDGSRCILTQDVHGNIFGIEIQYHLAWTSLEDLTEIRAVYQVNRPSNLHSKDCFDRNTTKVWIRPETVLTMQEIADKFGIDVNQLKIKK